MAAICTRIVGKCFHNGYRNLISSPTLASNIRSVFLSAKTIEFVTGLSRNDPLLICTPAVTVRLYSKAKDKSKGDKKKKNVVQINEDEIKELVNFDKLKHELERSLDQLKADYVKNLSLRSNLSIDLQLFHYFIPYITFFNLTYIGSIENLPIDFEGDTYSLQELAQITKKGPQLLVVNVSSFPTAVTDVVKAINESGMGLNPQQDGTKVFIQIPKVTKEHREQLAKNAKLMFQKFKDHTRDVQNKYIREVKKKEKEVSADLAYSVQQQIQSYNEQITQDGENIMLAKQKELLQKD